MKLFMTLILSLMLAIAPVMPQLAYAEPPLGYENTEKPADPENSFQVVNLGDEENPLWILIIDLHEKETLKKTFKGIGVDVDNTIREFPNLRSVVLTIHPRDIPETREDESKRDSITHMFWDMDDSKTVTKAFAEAEAEAEETKAVARAVNVPERRLHSFRRMTAPANTHTRDIMDFVNDRNADSPGAASFMRLLFEKDINEINIERPHWDKTTSAIRGVATAIGVLFGVNFMAEDPTLFETSVIVGIPTLAAVAAGLWNKSLAQWEEGRVTDENEKLTKMQESIRKVKSVFKNGLLATGFVASFYVPMSWFGYVPSMLEPGLFLAAAGMALGNNIAKKTAAVRALTTWKYDKYQENPQNAAKYSRFHAWAMAAVGALITATDVWQLTLPKDEPMYWAISGTMFAGGYVAYKSYAKIERVYKKAKTKCNSWFRKDRKKNNTSYPADDIQ